jgi:glycosyltransferase involved in cell wall biosynthesis
MKSVLLVTDVPFWLQRKGNHQRIAAMLTYLANHFRITVVFLGIEKPQLRDDNVTVIHACRHRGLTELAWKLFRALPGRLQQTIIRLLDKLNLQRSLDSFGDDHVVEQFSSIYNADHFDAVIIEYIWHGYLAKAVDQKQSLLLLDTHDIFHRRIAEYARFGRTPDKTVTKEQELDVYKQFSQLIAIQTVEYDYLDKIYPGHVVLAMHPVKAHPGRYTERMCNSSDAGKLTLIYFASYGDANVDAIEWFVDEVWNDQLAEKFELQIHGAICDSLRISKTGVRIYGRSPTVDAVYRDADIAINPQRFGSGLKIKTVEAMGYGVPSLTTSVGAEGLEDAKDQALLCADDAADMQRQLLRLSDVTLRKFLSQNGLEFVAHRLTPEACFGPLHQLIDAHHPENLPDNRFDD